MSLCISLCTFLIYLDIKFLKLFLLRKNENVGTRNTFLPYLSLPPMHNMRFQLLLILYLYPLKQVSSISTILPLSPIIYVEYVFDFFLIMFIMVFIIPF